MVTNKTKIYFFVTYTLCLCWIVSHLIYFSLTKKIMLQYFRPSAKLLLYRQARSQGGPSGAVLPNFIVQRKICSKHIVKTNLVPAKMYFFPKLNT